MARKFAWKKQRMNNLSAVLAQLGLQNIVELMGSAMVIHLDGGQGKDGGTWITRPQNVEVDECQMIFDFSPPIAITNGFVNHTKVVKGKNHFVLQYDTVAFINITSIQYEFSSKEWTATCDVRRNNDVAGVGAAELYDFLVEFQK